MAKAFTYITAIIILAVHAVLFIGIISGHMAAHDSAPMRADVMRPFGVR